MAEKVGREQGTIPNTPVVEVDSSASEAGVTKPPPLDFKKEWHAAFTPKVVDYGMIGGGGAPQEPGTANATVKLQHIEGVQESLGCAPATKARAHTPELGAAIGSAGLGRL